MLEKITLDEIKSASERLVGVATRTPLVRLNYPENDSEIYLKLENLQPIGSFKLRGAYNAIAMIGADQLANGVSTSSAGNMAQGVAWSANKFGVPSEIFVPDHAPQTKVDAITRLGGKVIKAPFATWWQSIIDHGYPEMNGTFIHPFLNSQVVTGNATVGLEILEDLPDVDSIIVPFGGGGLSLAIATAVGQLGSKATVYASEVETAAPFSAALNANQPTTVEYTPSFVDSIGSTRVIDEIWQQASKLLSGSLVVSLQEIKESIAILANRNRVVAEGAGASSVAAAVKAKNPGKTVCVVSGGNINTDTFIQIMAEMNKG